MLAGATLAYLAKHALAVALFDFPLVPILAAVDPLRLWYDAGLLPAVDRAINNAVPFTHEPSWEFPPQRAIICCSHQNISVDVLTYLKFQLSRGTLSLSFFLSFSFVFEPRFDFGRAMDRRCDVALKTTIPLTGAVTLPRWANRGLAR